MSKATKMNFPYTDLYDYRRKQWMALRFLREGQPIAEVEKEIGIPHAALERMLIEAHQRQVLIREHLQGRRDLTSLRRYPNRGPWGRGNYFGNCNGYLLVDLIDYFKPSSVFDPMEGSGTTGDVCADLNVKYVGWDLQCGLDLLSSPLPDRPFDMVFWHPPYWPAPSYSDHPNDLANARSAHSYLERLRAGFERLPGLLSPSGRLVILIGDGRKQGIFYPFHSEIIRWGLLPLEMVLIKDGDHARRSQHFRYGPARFIPTLHEYVLIFKQGEP